MRSLAEARDDTNLGIRGGKEVAIRINSKNRSGLACESPLLSHNDPKKTCHPEAPARDLLG